MMTPEPALMKAAGRKGPRPAPNAVQRETAREPSEGERLRDSETKPAKKTKATQTPSPTVDVFDDVVNNDLFD